VKLQETKMNNRKHQILIQILLTDPQDNITTTTTITTTITTPTDHIINPIKTVLITITGQDIRYFK